MEKLFSPALALHLGCGFMAMTVGLVPIFSRKGSRLHRLSGRVFVSLMSAMLVAAWVMTVLRFSTYFAALSATATITLFSGLRVLGRKRPDLIDRRQRAKLADWLAAAIVMAIGAWVLVLLAAGRSTSPPGATIALAWAALFYGGWDLWRFTRPLDWPFSPRLWTYEHLVKMLSAYGALVSAFSGNFLTFLPKPWSQLWPTLLFQPLAVIWIVLLAQRHAKASSAA
ncbi:MAG: hypothetical protein J7521_18915 [Caulobacter sp.]|nr:hypothetical protein [Caulobacter sp.]